VNSQCRSKEGRLEALRKARTLFITKVILNSYLAMFYKPALAPILTIDLVPNVLAKPLMEARETKLYGTCEYVPGHSNGTGVDWGMVIS